MSPRGGSHHRHPAVPRLVARCTRGASRVPTGPHRSLALRPLGQVGMARVDRGSKGGEGPARGGNRRLRAAAHIRPRAWLQSSAQPGRSKRPLEPLTRPRWCKPLKAGSGATSITVSHRWTSSNAAAATRVRIVMETMAEPSVDGTVDFDYAHSGLTWRSICSAAVSKISAEGENRLRPRLAKSRCEQHVEAHG
jgi:hypothetical protein